MKFQVREGNLTLLCNDEDSDPGILGIIMNLDMNKVLTREEFAQIQIYMTGNKLPPEIQEEITNHYHATKSSTSMQTVDLFSGMSLSLQVDTARYLYRDIISETDIFEDCSDNFLNAICVVLEEALYSPEEVIFNAGQSAPAVFFVQRGAVEQVVDTDRGKVTRMSTGTLAASAGTAVMDVQGKNAASTGQSTRYHREHNNTTCCHLAIQ